MPARKDVLPALFVAKFRSRLEASVANRIMESGIDWCPDRDYESHRFEFTIPARKANYTPEFVFPDHKVIIETKGYWHAAQERQRMILFAEQNPEWELRFIFQRANTPIYKGSKTTCEKWANDHGFKYAIATIPDSWIQELK
jgi:hypothetical protein